METSVSGEPVFPGHFGLAIRAIVFGALLGAALVSIALWGAKTIQGPVAPGVPVTGGPVFTLVVGGTFAGPVLAILAAWSLMRALYSPYRRMGLAILAGFLALLVALPTTIIFGLMGTAGLLGFAALCVCGCAFLARRVVAGWRSV